MQANVSTNAPLAAADIARFLNSAYATIWSLSGGRIKKVASATAWTTAQSATGTVTGILTDVETIQHVFASLTSGSTGSETGDVEVQPCELAEIQFYRHGSGFPTYSVPKKYAVTRLATATPASVNLLQLDYWPSVTGFYLPIWYVPQFTPIDASTVTTPDVNDLESHDIFLLAAATAAPLLNRPELVSGIMADLSEKTRLALKRRGHALMEGKQNDSERRSLAV